MSESDKNMKYLIETSTGIKILINRAGKIYSKVFSYRKNGGRDRTISVAILDRDKAHIDLFGVPVSSGFNHVVKKKGSLNPELPPGISLGYSREELLYVVVNFMKDGKPSRARFNIKKLSYEIALERAIKKKSEIDKELYK